MLETPNGMPIQDIRQGSDQVDVEDILRVRVPLVRLGHLANGQSSPVGRFSHFGFQTQSLSVISTELDGLP